MYSEYFAISYIALAPHDYLRKHLTQPPKTPAALAPTLLVDVLQRTRKDVQKVLHEEQRIAPHRLQHHTSQVQEIRQKTALCHGTQKTAEIVPE